MDPRKLRYFLQVAESGSFTKAAEIIGVAQPALSQQVASLERELSVRLLYRTGRGASLTDVGAEFLPRAQYLLREIERVRDDVAVMSRSPHGRISLGVPPSVSHALISSLVLRLREGFPEIRLTLIEGSSGFLREWISKGRVDVGILYGLRPYPEIRSEILLVEGLSLVGPAGDPVVSRSTVSFESLADLPLILPSRPHGLRTLIDRASGKRGISLTVALELDGVAMVRDLVGSGCGFAILPDVAVLHDSRGLDVECARIVDPEITRTMVIASSNERHSDLATRTVINLLWELAHQLHPLRITH